MRKLINIYSMVLFFCSCSMLQHRQLKDINHWGYQLQNYKGKFDYNRIYKSSNMLWVIDAHTDDNQILSKDKVKVLQENNNIIISYFSIGEAESYRNYYKAMPKNLLLQENKNWSGNYRVKYWLPKWRSIMINYLSEILDAGFDGIYLDIVDAFDYYSPLKLKKIRAQQMLELVSSMHTYAKKRNPNFKFIQQNGTSIISFLENDDDWFNQIDAVGIESMFFSGPHKMNNSMKLDSSIIKYLKEYRLHHLPIFSVEYIDQKVLLQQYRTLAKKYDVIPVAASRYLNGPLIFSSRILN